MLHSFSGTSFVVCSDEAGSSANILLEAAHRSRVVELLILHVQVLCLSLCVCVCVCVYILSKHGHSQGGGWVSGREQLPPLCPSACSQLALSCPVSHDALPPVPCPLLPFAQWLKCKIRDGGMLHSGLGPWQWSCAFIPSIITMWGGGMLWVRNWRWGNDIPLRPITL